VKALDNFYNTQPEPHRSTLLALRDIVLALDPHITPEWKYKLPFFYYKGKMFCYLWVHKKFRQPYISFVHSEELSHPLLLLEKRAKMKILLIDPDEDIPVELLQEFLQTSLNTCRNKLFK
jgi:hypothetical protein